MVRVKICGITNLDDARCAAKAGVDFLGFIFYPKSPRFVTPEQVSAITRTLRRELGASAPRFVGVFVDEAVDRVQTTLDTAYLDLAQLHGNERAEQMRRLHPRAFKAVRPRTLTDAKAAISTFGDLSPGDTALPQLLMDAYHPKQLGGTGLQADLPVAQWAALQCRLLLAGGLTPVTVGPAIEATQPWGVDVSSGVERVKGIKDHARIRAFIHAVRGER
ncbi:N-(5'-phosphoribosyl)anthranilate isomerase [Chloroflexota bacterium]